MQDETGGFQAFIPLAYHRENNRLRKLPEPTAADDLRMIAVSRLLLDNIPHIKAYWVMLGVKMAQLGPALRRRRHGRHGDRGEDLPHGRRKRPNALTVEELCRQIRAIGREPVERTTMYEKWKEVSS